MSSKAPQLEINWRYIGFRVCDWLQFAGFTACLLFFGILGCLAGVAGVVTVVVLLLWGFQ